MPNDKRSLMARALARIAGPEAIKKNMDSRQERLGTDKTGGMFDFIYRKKKEREQAMNDAYNIDASTAASTSVLPAEDPAANTAALRGLGPDDPIEWNAYGSQPVQPPQAPPGFLERIFGPGIPHSAQAAPEPQTPAWLMKLLMREKKKAPTAEGQYKYGL